MDDDHDEGQGQATSITLSMRCPFCTGPGQSKEIVVQLPEGWTMLYTEGLDLEDEALCHQHAALKEFFSKQCPGCVASPGNDCPLFQSFAYEAVHRPLTETDLKAIRCGICPRRVNGTTMFSRELGFREMRLDEKAPDAAGEALASAIGDYCKFYNSGRKAQ